MVMNSMEMKLSFFTVMKDLKRDYGDLVSLKN